MDDLEDHTLRVSITHVEDLAGNRSGAIPPWEFTVKRSLFTWGKPVVTFDAPAERTSGFSLDLINGQAEAVTYSLQIQGSPAWLTATGSGSLGALETEAIAFEVDPTGLALGAVRLEVLDVRGRLVETLFRGRAAAGGHEVAWEGRDASGQPAAAGVYFLRLVSGGTTRAQRIVLRLGWDEAPDRTSTTSR